jgi:hypothetical protein
MQINLNPPYISDSSSARRQPIPIDINLDPTANSITAPFKQSRWNGYISPIGANKNLSAMLVGIQTASFSNPYTGGDPGGGVGGTNPEPIFGNAPLEVANLAASYVGSDIVLTFDFDLSDPNNQFFFNFNVGVSVDNGTTFTIISPAYSASILSPSSVNQSVTIKSTDSGFANSVSFNYIEVATYDSANQTAGYVKSAISNTYQCLLPAPILTEADATSSYTITTTNLDTAKNITNGNFLSEIIQEFVYPIAGLTSDQVDAAVSTSQVGWVQVGEPKTVSPTSIFAADGAHRYVRSFFLDSVGGKSNYSNYVEATPGALLPANNLPPSNATNVSAAFDGTGNTGDNIVITYTLPTIVDSDVNKPVTVKVKLIPTSANTFSGFFYHTIGSKTETSFTIPANLIFSQFGQYYTSYSGTFVLQSQYGTESSTVQNLNTFSRTSSIKLVTPTATITNVIDGYNVQFALGASGAAHGEVYQFFIDPTGSFDKVDVPDYMDAAFVSGGASGQNTLVVSSIIMENGEFTLPSGKSVNTYIGYPITGTGIPSNTWVTSISGSGPYTITLNNNLTQQAAGNYHMQALIYSGIGPANIFDNLYQTVYLILRYYDIYGGSSQNSIVYQATPTSSSTSVIQNAVQIGSGGSIYVGSSATTGSRIVLGPSGNKGPDGTSAYSGIFAFDYGSTVGSAASTAIITNPGASSYTFETTNAKIADWVINSQYIQNTLGLSSNYVGLSATAPNGYSFWAGSATSGGDSQAKFTVTPGGAVVARNIQIIGSGNNSDTLISAGSYFSVKGDGTVNASNANITGSINVNQASTFNSSVTIGSSGYLIVGSTYTANVKIGSAGIVASPDGLSITTQISSSPIGADGVTLATNSAYLGSLSGATGAWIVKAGKIYSGQLELSSANGTITAYPTDYNSTQNNYGVRMYGGSSTSNGYAFSVGSLSGTPNFFVDHLGKMTASSATIKGNITATTGILGDPAGKYWNINNNYIKSTGSDSYIILDAVGDQIQAYAASSVAPGSLITYSASNVGGSITSATSTAAGLETTAYFGAGKISSNAYTVISTAKPLQVFGSAQPRGSLPLFSLDPDGSSTTWNHTNDNGATYTQQNVGESFAAINTGVIYLNSDDIIMGAGPSSYAYLNGNYTLRNDTDVVGTHQYLRNIYINSGPGPTVGSTGTGFVGDLYITY